MSIPDFQSLMLPVLEACAAGPLKSAELRHDLASTLGLTSAELEERLPSGRQAIFHNRVAWALSHLKMAGLLDRVGRGTYQLAEEGRRALSEKPARIDLKFLERYPQYLERRQGTVASEGAPLIIPGTSALPSAPLPTPDELIATSYAALLSALQDEVLARLRAVSPADFESIIIDLLVALGYGGGRSEMGQAIGGSGDSGIDGLIKEDALGLDVVYVQAKRYAAAYSVSRPEVQSFAGSLDGVGATKGLFFTTSAFTSGAREFAAKISKRIILVDGKEMARLMVQHDVGVRAGTTFVLKKIDEDYFQSDAD